MLKLLYADPEGVYWEGDSYIDYVDGEGVGCSMSVSGDEKEIKVDYYCGC